MLSVLWYYKSLIISTISARIWDSGIGFSWNTMKYLHLPQDRFSQTFPSFSLSFESLLSLSSHFVSIASIFPDFVTTIKSGYISRLPRLTPEGTLEKKNVIYVNDEYMERVYGRSGKTLVDICRRASIDSIEALSRSWNISLCFHLAQVQEVFLEQKKRKDFVDSIKNGMVTVGGLEYISATGIAERYGVYYGRAQTSLSQISLRHIVGPNIARGNSKYYLLSDVEEKLRPLLTL